MSWLDQINNDFVITTGDAQTYKPQWLNATKTVTYNISDFEFPTIAGTLINRGTPKGTKYNIEIYFQGEDNLDQASAFQKSADDPRAWVISHPFYGEITVQPLNLDYDNTNYNITEIKGTVVETITEDIPKITIDPVDKITQDKADNDEVYAEQLAAWQAAIIARAPSNVTPIINHNISDTVSIYKEGVKKIKSDIDAEAYFNFFNIANTKIITLASDPLSAVRAVQAVINYPSQFAASIKDRMTVLINQSTNLYNGIVNLLTPSDKKIYEVNAGGVIATMALTSVTNPDYTTRTDVINIVGSMLTYYNQYIASLDTLQTINAGSTSSYIPDADSLIGLNDLMNFTISQLFNIALNSKQERSILCEDDTNIILLAHRFYGLTVDDATLNQLISTNGIALSEILQIKKGRKIVYYV